jgi:hypothetical protein
MYEVRREQDSKIIKLVLRWKRRGQKGEGNYFGNSRYVLGRPRRRRDDNMKMDLQEVGWGVWNGLIWLRIGKRGGLL